jgi:hypothetical protein
MDDCEWWIGKDVEGSSCVAYFKVKSQYLPRGTEENHEKPQSV